MTPEKKLSSLNIDLPAALHPAGKLRATAATCYGSINAENLMRAHAALEEGRVIGKITLSGF